MNPSVAIVGMACRYPDARSPVELWENALSQRRAFRRMPPERLRIEDYLGDKDTPDATYATEAALIEGYEFDRVHFRVAGSTYRSADLAHWLALDIASQALSDAGFIEGEGLPRETTGVMLGNTLTGEFSRANVMRLRWPYVRRVVEARLVDEGWSEGQRREFLDALETQYKEPFPPVGEETLAGGLSNTIAGRICNHFDLKGGGYTVDGACASSLLAITNACQSLVSGDLDVALAGGVDLSLDPFELVGFAKTGALAPDEMRVYDARSAGFWPGEGCGFVALMRQEDALAMGRRVYATIRGWGVSSDGSGGITRPEVEGQLLAIKRAYKRAGFGIDSVSYFEGHGTGTNVGDATELQVLSRARKEADQDAPPAAISSVKANIGHTKAAAGVAGLIKATMAVHTQVLPPITGCEEPHSLFTGEAPALRVLREGEIWPQNRPLRAGVSAMGFGGINTHVVLEGATAERKRALGSRDHAVTASAQDAELFLFGARDAGDLQAQIERVLAIAPRLSRAELGDAAAQLQKAVQFSQVRAALVASTPVELADRLQSLKSWIADGVKQRIDTRNGLFLGAGNSAPRIGFLFPGQGSPSHLDGGIMRRRFEQVRDLYAWANLPVGGDSVATQVAQPAIVTASLAALRVLDLLDITANVSVGHSLGELTALYWAGALDRDALLRIVTTRGKAMADLGSPTGAMASIKASQIDVKALVNGDAVTIAGLNSPQQTVISGEMASIATVVTRARNKGLQATSLPVSHAFHSPLVAASVTPLAEQLSRESFQPLQSKVVSTVTGALLTQDADLPTLIRRQITEPVRFMEAVQAASESVDLFIEVGPGRVLSGLAAESTDKPVISIDAGSPSLRGLLQAAGAAYAMGAPLNHEALFAGRFTRPFNLDWHPLFFANPCELAPVVGIRDQGSGIRDEASQKNVDPTAQKSTLQESENSKLKTQNSKLIPLDLVRQLVAARAELPSAAVKDSSRLLSDLHLNSITVGQLVVEAAGQLGLAPPLSPTDYADATVAEVAQALEEIERTGGIVKADDERAPAGVDSWVRTFVVELVERPLLTHQTYISPLQDASDWRIIAPDGCAFAERLRKAFTTCHGSGVAVCLPPNLNEHNISLLLEGAHVALEHRENVRFVLVQQGGGSSSFAKTLYLEAPEITVCVVDLPTNHPQAMEWILAEAQAAHGYWEAHYDAAGTRREPVLRLAPLSVVGARHASPLPLGPDDVLLVTGGGKGIASECALSLARETGVRLALMGRSQPKEGDELSANLDRIASMGVTFRYIAADVTDAEAVRAAVHKVEAELGPVTGVLHGAGTNTPQLLSVLDEAAMLRTLAPKVQGARNVLAAVNPDHLRLFVGFSSIIARTGMKGEADYALANEWLSRLAESWQSSHPHCRCLSVEWSVWAGVGMGERLGKVEALMREGISPISPDEGISMLRDLIAEPLPSVSVVVAGRFGEPPTLRMDKPELPFLRFLEKPRTFYPGIELVVDAELSINSDPYLADHAFHGEPLLPAVVGLEAMAQAAMALVGSDVPPAFSDVKLTRPVVVPERAAVTIRLVALVREPGVVEVSLRSEESGFGVDHFRATCLFGDRGSGIGDQGSEIFDGDNLVIDPERDLYGEILFHSGRFMRLRGYRLLTAKECVAEIAPYEGSDWFGRYLPQELALGDFTARDAVIHAIQACIPHATLLPTGIDRLTVFTPHAPGPWLLHAKERARAGDTFIYDLEVTGADGCLRERWEGLYLRRVEGNMPQKPWPEALLVPYIERRLEELGVGIRDQGSGIRLAFERAQSVERSSRSDAAIGRALGERVRVTRRPDGKPEVNGSVSVSVAHAGDLALAVTGSGPLGCDMEPVTPRSEEVWRGLLGVQRFELAQVIAQATGEEYDSAATRVWAVGESLKKAGAAPDAPLVLASTTTDGWALLQSGELVGATWAAHVKGFDNRVVFSVLAEGQGIAS